MKIHLSTALASLANTSIGAKQTASAALPGQGQRRKLTAVAVAPVAVAPPIEPFVTGQLGGFPYYWQDPSSGRFNAKTYNWINANLLANTTPAQQAPSYFTSLYLQALSCVNYSLSKADVAALNAAAAAGSTQQLAVLNAWQALMGCIPPAVGNSESIDLITQTVASTWAVPPTTLPLMANSPDLAALLNKAPVGSEGVVSALQAFLQTNATVIPIENSMGLYRGQLAEAMQALQSPSQMNGGLTTNDNQIVPCYHITQPVTQILAELNGTASPLQVTMKIAAQNGGYAVSINGQPPQVTSSLDFLSINSLNLDQYLVSNKNPVEVTATFPGLAVVDFGPARFDGSVGANWFWMDPIRAAISNGSADTSGFTFLPNPQIDFSASGPFGILTSIAISKHPSISIKAASGAFQTDGASLPMTNADVSFGNQGTIVNCATTTQSVPGTKSGAPMQSVTFAPVPTPDTVNSVAFVLGVKTWYPAANQPVPVPNQSSNIPALA